MSKPTNNRIDTTKIKRLLIEMNDEYSKPDPRSSKLDRDYWEYGISYCNLARGLVEGRKRK